MPSVPFGVRVAFLLGRIISDFFGLAGFLLRAFKNLSIARTHMLDLGVVAERGIGNAQHVFLLLNLKGKIGGHAG
jgi:hypothetical protein